MGIAFKKETNNKKIVSDLINIMSIYNGIVYDYELYDIIKKDIIIEKHVGFIVKYKVPAGDACYIDILIFPEYRKVGIGSESLVKFIHTYLREYKYVYIKSKCEYKKLFLTKNEFKYIKENLYKDLFLFEHVIKA